MFPVGILLATARYGFGQFPINMFMITAMFSWCVWVPVSMFFFPISMFYDCDKSCQDVFLPRFLCVLGHFVSVCIFAVS